MPFFVPFLISFSRFFVQDRTKKRLVCDFKVAFDRRSFKIYFLTKKDRYIIFLKLGNSHFYSILFLSPSHLTIYIYIEKRKIQKTRWEIGPRFLLNFQHQKFRFQFSILSFIQPKYTYDFSRLLFILSLLYLSLQKLTIIIIIFTL